MDKGRQVGRGSITPAGVVAFRVKTGVVEVPVFEHGSSREGEGVSIIINGISRECVAVLKKALAATKGDLSFANELSGGFLNSLRITDTFKLEAMGEGESAEAGSFQTPNDIRSKILGVLIKVLETAGAVFAKNDEVDSVAVRIKPDWGCTEAMPEG